jgi:hypothetical protein
MSDYKEGQAYEDPDETEEIEKEKGANTDQEVEDPSETKEVEEEKENDKVLA